MNYKLLGRSGLRVSEICLGTMTFGEAWGWGSDLAESRRILDIFMAAGGNFIDSANIYTSGEAERMLGELIGPSRRNRMVLTSKYGDALPCDDPNASGNHRKNMMQSVEDSLKRLKTDRIDLYFIHTWDYTARADEVMRGLDDLARQGKIIYAGISNAPAWVIARCNELADQRGWSPFVVNQIEYSLLARGADREILPMSRALDVGMMGWSPLAGGLLSGKYTRPAGDGTKRRMDAAPYKPLTDTNLAIATAVDLVADEIGCSSACVALARVAAQGVIPIVGAKTAAQMDGNLGFPSIALTPAQLERLEAASRIERGYPFEFYDSAKGFVYGGMFGRIHRHREDGIGTSRDQPAEENAFSYTDVMTGPAAPAPKT